MAVSKRVLEYYSNIRLDAKRTALEGLSQRVGQVGYDTNFDTNETESANEQPQVVVSDLIFERPET